MTQKPLYKRGDRVLIVDKPTSIFHPVTYAHDGTSMHRFLNKAMTITGVKVGTTGIIYYLMKEDKNRYCWTEETIQRKL